MLKTGCKIYKYCGKQLYGVFCLQFIYRESQKNNETSGPAVASIVPCINKKVIKKIRCNTQKLVPAGGGNAYNFRAPNSVKN